MIAIELTFPAGRWHATPWGRQVNEGAVEWPPAPWRLLRALLAVWYHKCPDVPEEEMRRLIGVLGSPPSFYLPPTSQGHTRHFMPTANDIRTKIFDTFVTLAPEDALVVVWPDAVLDESLAGLLDHLLIRLTYFGRAESWVEAKLLESWDGEPNTVPMNGHAADESAFERARVLMPVPEEEYSDWRGSALQAQLDRKLEEKRQKARDKGKDDAKVKLSKKEQSDLESSLPETIFDALHATTGDLRKAGWNRPPGSRWVEYLRPGDAFASKPQQKRLVPRSQKATIARFAVCGKVLPRLTETLLFAEDIRRFLMGCSKYVSAEKNASATFSGKSADEGACRDDGHLHAHLLVESTPESRSISHLTVFSPTVQHDNGISGGFTQEDENALRRISTDKHVRERLRHHAHPIQLVLLGIGHPEDFGGTGDSSGESRLLDKSRVWESRTPFVPTDHLRIRPGEAKDPKRREEAVRRELERILRKEMERRDWLTDHLSRLDKVEVLLGRKVCGTDLGGHFTRWLKFRRMRQKGNGHRGDSGGYGFRLTFKEPVRGPIVLGYGCHFGLGQFWVPPAND